MTGKAAGVHKKQRQVQTHHESKIPIRRVTAQGNAIWEIQEPEGDGILKGCYLGQENLCQIELGDDNFSVTARFKCRYSDVHLDDFQTTTKNPFKFTLTNNKEKMLDILGAKAIKDENGELFFSRATLTRQKS